MHVDHDGLLAQSLGGPMPRQFNSYSRTVLGFFWPAAIATSPPEIDGLLTAVQEFARAARIATPQLDAITALVIEKARRMGLYPFPS
jgi:hypothetical protein